MPSANASNHQFDRVVKAISELALAFGSLVMEWAWSELVIQAGWLPHASIPPELIADAKSVEEADLRLAEFFRTNWPQISESLRRSVHDSDTDPDAREAFDECLRAHFLGMYRVAPALLFPHIERVARDALLPGAMGASAASVMFEAVGELGPSEFTIPGVSGVRLYSKLAEHLYKQVRTPAEVDAARMDPLPNRNAALHGRVSYTSEKSSVNMLIMTTFIFDAVSKIVRERVNRHGC